jgi:hypothetical protein
MIRVHMGERVLLGKDQLLRLPDFGQQLRARQLRGAREASIEMGLRRVEPPKGEIGKAGIKRGLRMRRKEAPADALVLDAVSFETRDAAGEREARMCERVAASEARKHE